jgi:hypothetical protein
MQISYESVILKPPRAVFPWIADPGKAMQWQKNVKGGEIIFDAPATVGTTFTEIIEDESGMLEMTGTITGYIEGELISFHIESRIHAFDVSYSLEEIPTGTKISIATDIRWKFPMNIMSVFIGEKMKKGILRGLESEVLELKALCESG